MARRDRGHVGGALWAAFGAPVAFAYSAVLFLAGAVLVWRLKEAGIPPEL